MTELRLSLADNATIEYEGRVFNTGTTGTEVMADWEDRQCQKTYERLIRVGIAMKMPTARQDAIDAIARLSAQGEFDFYGETSQKKMDTVDGLKLLFFIRIRQCHPDVTKKTIDAMIDAEFERTLRLQHEREQAALEAILPNDEAPAGAKDDASAGAPLSLAS